MRIMNVKVIDKVFDEIISKCSNKEIKAKLANMSQDEKDERLKGKLNGFEEKHYRGLFKNLEHCKDMLELSEEEDSSFRREMEADIEEINELLFNYEKRIFRGYDLDKNKDNVPSFNLDDYSGDGDATEDFDTVVFGDVEQGQMDNQVGLDLTDDEISGLQAYFGKNSSSINVDLDHNYGSGWDNYPTDEQESIHESNKDTIKNIDSTMGKSDGLLQPTLLYTGVQHSHLVDVHTRIGDKINMKSYISASFRESVAKGYGGLGYDGYVNIDIPKLYVRFLAPNGLKGICANTPNKDLTRFNLEHEYLLDRGQSGTVVDIDYDTGCVTVLLE